MTAPVSFPPGFKLLGRDPVLILGLVNASLQMVVAFFLPLSVAQVAGINAVAAFALGVIAAALVASDHLVPAVLGLAQALLTLGLVFGAHVSDTQQGAVMSFVALAAAFLARTQVTAPVDAQGNVSAALRPALHVGPPPPTFDDLLAFPAPGYDPWAERDVVDDWAVPGPESNAEES